jgi:hypothetical protein
VLVENAGFGISKNRAAAPGESANLASLGFGQGNGVRQDQHPQAIVLQGACLNHGGGQDARLNGDFGKPLQDLPP